MPELRLFPLEEVLGEPEIEKLRTQLAELGVEELPAGDDVIDLDARLSESQLDDFMDRLDAHDIACDIYLPVEFDGVVGVGERSVGSAFTLADALEELRDELDVDGDAGAEEDDEDPGAELEMIERELGYAWQVFARAALACTKRQVPLHVIA